MAKAAQLTMKARMKTNTACSKLIPCYSCVLWDDGLYRWRDRMSKTVSCVLTMSTMFSVRVRR